MSQSIITVFLISSFLENCQLNHKLTSLLMTNRQSNYSLKQQPIFLHRHKAKCVILLEKSDFFVIKFPITVYFKREMFQ